MDYMNIGSSPSGENCVQVGDENYSEKSRKECKAYINQLRRVYGEEPFGARLAIKTFSHDFGSYNEVICKFHEEQEEAVEYAFIDFDKTGKWKLPEGEYKLRPLSSEYLKGNRWHEKKKKTTGKKSVFKGRSLPTRKALTACQLVKD